MEGVKEDKAGSETASATVQVAEGSYEEAINTIEEKKVVRKMDLNLITLFGALYLMSFLGEYVMDGVYSIG
jgi:hypothetical protein